MRIVSLFWEKGKSEETGSEHKAQHNTCFFNFSFNIIVRTAKLTFKHFKEMER